MFRGNLHEFDGEMLTVKMIAGKVKLAPSTLYKYLNQGMSLYDSIEAGKKQSERVFKSRKTTNNRTAKKYSWKDKMLTVLEIAEIEGISSEPIYRRLKKGMSLIDAINEIKSNISTKYPFLGTKLSRYQLERLTGVSRSYLITNLLDDIEYTEEQVMDILDSYKKQEILMYGEETLLTYCIRNNYNYYILYRLIKDKGYTEAEAVSLYTNPNYEIKEKSDTLMYGEETLRAYCIRMKYNYNSVYYGINVLGCTIDESISRYLEVGQTSNPNYKYIVGNVLLSHFLLKMGIDDRYVLLKMREGKSVECAIIDAIFLSNEEYGTKPHRNRLRAIYSEIRDISELKEINIKYSLTTEDIDFITIKNELIQKVLIQLKLYKAISELRETISMTKFVKMFTDLGFTIQELLLFVEELYNGFEEQEEIKQSPLKYIWYKGM